ncbi:MAG: hypothetical protein IT557_13280 [Alphaproteobacteria bacterium]|nr:hypothetical protein [Alphaproteobacteria bacterium]
MSTKNNAGAASTAKAQEEALQKADLESLRQRDDAEFDQWLSAELRRLFDPMLDEPVPDFMLKALQDALARRGKA